MNPSAAAEPAVEARGLIVRFGAIEALRGIDFELAAGEAVALFGPNGAGKTTLIRVLTLALRPGEGTIRIAGLDPAGSDRAIRARIGVISHHSYLYDDLTARQNLEFFARLYGIEQAERRAGELLETFELTSRGSDAVGTLSRGLQQRVSLARALVHDPQIVFLDEPFTGLDPQAARTLSRLLERLRDEGRSVLLVTHNLARGLELSDRWLLLSAGRVLDQGRSAETDRARFETEYFRHFEKRATA